MILLGTSGYSYADWVGTFYPAGTRPRDMLALYATRFSAVEINATYYRLPGASTFEGFARLTPAPFRFTVKLPGSITHEQSLDACGRFVEVVRPLVESRKLGCALAQFPYSFKNTAAARDHVARMAGRLEPLSIVVEFRHRSWQAAGIESFLEAHQLGLACVDEPALPGLMAPEARRVGAIGYVRFHGRNSEKWFRHQHAAERYDYRYSHGELEPWAARVREMDDGAEEVYVFFNNHFEGKAPADAVAFASILGLRLAAPAPGDTQGRLF